MSTIPNVTILRGPTGATGATGAPGGTAPIAAGTIFGNPTNAAAPPSAINPSTARDILEVPSDAELAALLAPLASVAYVGATFAPIAHNHSADHITSGSLAKARQHAQTAYLDVANTFSSVITFANTGYELRIDGSSDGPRLQSYMSKSLHLNPLGNPVTLPTNTWHGSWNGVVELQRFYFADGSTTYIQGHGSTPLIFRNGSGDNVIIVDNSGGTTFNGSATINGHTRIVDTLTKGTETGFDAVYDSMLRYQHVNDFASPNRASEIDASITAGLGVSNAIRIRPYSGTTTGAPVTAAIFKGDQSSEFLGVVTCNTLLNIGSADCRLFRDSGNLYIESDGSIVFRDTSSSGFNMLIADGVLRLGDTSGKPMIAPSYDGNLPNHFPCGLVVEPSSVAIGLAWGMYQNGSASWVSGWNYASVPRTALLNNFDGLRYIATPATTATPGSALPAQPVTVFSVSPSGVVTGELLKGPMDPRPITKAALLTLSATATSGEHRITDSTPAQRRAYPDGTNWRYSDDSTIVT